MTNSVTENTSGQGAAAVLPEEIRGWNWGAVLLTWIWAIGNRVWLGLLGLVPWVGSAVVFLLVSAGNTGQWIMFLPQVLSLVGAAVPITLGLKGNEWAWRNKKWDSIEHFKRTQRTWAWWGLAAAIVNLTAGILLFRSFYGT